MKLMKASIFGIGQMGIGASNGMKELGYDVTSYDVDDKNKNLVHNFVQLNKNDKLEVKESTDVVLSCLPYYLNGDLALDCAKKGIPYCDLGGQIKHTEYIEELKKQYKSPLVTDLGLAPGLIGILGIKILNDLDFTPDDIILSVGGMGEHDAVNFPSYYTCNWSLDGLINEYMDDCTVLKDGKIVKEKSPIASLIDSRFFESDNHFKKPNEYEISFRTSGGIGNFVNIAQRYGVKNCEYHTIRLKEHLQFLRMTDRDNLKNDFKRFCKPFRFQSDYVVIRIIMKKGKLEYKTERYFYQNVGDPPKMQALTTSTLCAVANIISSGTIINDYSEIAFKHWKSFVKDIKYLHSEIDLEELL